MQQRARIIFARSPHLRLALQYARRISAATTRQAKVIAAHLCCRCLVAHLDDSDTSKRMESRQ